MSVAAADKPVLLIVAVLSLGFYAVHCGAPIREGDWHHLLWLSNVATLLLVFACLGRSPRAAGLAFLWLSLSAILWTFDVSIARAPIDTAIFTHVGSFALAVIAVRNLGVLRGTSWLAAAGLALLVGISRAITEPRHNVNLAFTVAEGWEEDVTSHGAYLAVLFVLSLALFFGVERVLARRVGATTAP